MRQKEEPVDRKSKPFDIDAEMEELLRATRADEREACAKIAETMDYAATDFGPEEPGKTFSGIPTFDNRNRDAPARIAAAIRARKD